MLAHRTASPSEPRGAATAVTMGAGLTVATVVCCVEGVCVRTIVNSSGRGAPAVRSAAPATARRVDRIRQYFEFTRINIEPIILRKEIEDSREARGPLGLRRASLTQLPRVRWVLRKESSWLAARRSVQIADRANLAAVRREMQLLMVTKEMVQTPSR